MDEKRHHGISLGEAFTGVVNEAIRKLPEQGDVVGIQVVLAYVTPELPPGSVEACGASVSRAGYPMDEVARLFALWADTAAAGWHPHPQNGRGLEVATGVASRGLASSGPRRRRPPRRRR